MTLKQLVYGKLIRMNQEREEHLKNMQTVLNRCQQENRSFTEEEQTTFDDLEQKISKIDKEFEKQDVTVEDVKARLDDLKERAQKSMNHQEKKTGNVKTRSINPLEVRSYKKGEQMGNGSNEVTIGDIIVGHTTGKYRSPEVRQLTTTQSGGVTISSEVFAGFIDKLRENSFIDQFTIYNMDSKTLTIPRLGSDVYPQFHIEAEEINKQNPIFEGVMLESKYLYCLTEISLELLESSAIDIGSAVNEIMLKAMMRAIQSYAVYGDVGGFTGILNDPDIRKIGTDVSYASIGEAIQTIQYQENGNPTSLVINPKDLMGLQMLTDGAGGQFITPPPYFDDLNIIVTGSMNPGQALLGDLSTVAMGVSSQNGIQLDISKDVGFSRGVVMVRSRFSGDIVLTQPRQLALVGAGVVA